MKRYLPKTSKASQGFTLVELMVVISIIAILAMIGLTLYNNTQKGARDARRQADLKAIANALEVNYDGAQYKALATTQFSAGSVPVDPSTGTSNCQSNPCKYCSKGVGGTATNCAAAPADPDVAAGVPGAASGYVICTNLETGTPSFLCLKNQR